MKGSPLFFTGDAHREYGSHWVASSILGRGGQAGDTLETSSLVVFSTSSGIHKTANCLEEEDSVGL